MEGERERSEEVGLEEREEGRGIKQNQRGSAAGVKGGRADE